MSAWTSINLHPDLGTLRRFGFVALGVFGALGACALQRWWMFANLGSSNIAVALGLGGVGLLAAALSLLAPEANRPLYVMLSVVGYPIGVALSWVTLAMLYFGIITPLGLVLRMLGRDALTRRYDRAARSYWTAAPQPRDNDEYFRQY